MEFYFYACFLQLKSNAACNTIQKKEEREKQKALKIMGNSGTVLDENTGKSLKYDIKSCKWKEAK